MDKTENQKIIEFIYRTNFFPGKIKLIKLVKKAKSDITEKEIIDYYDNEITTELTKNKTRNQNKVIWYHILLMNCGTWI